MKPGLLFAGLLLAALSARSQSEPVSPAPPGRSSATTTSIILPPAAKPRNVRRSKEGLPWQQTSRRRMAASRYRIRNAARLHRDAAAAVRDKARDGQTLKTADGAPPSRTSSTGP